MSEVKRISPMLDNFDVGGSISVHNGVTSYPAMRKDSDEKYILKTVSVPASQTQLDALLLTGAFPDATSALTYFKDISDQVAGELETLNKLSQLEGFLPFEDWQISAKDAGIGFDVYMIGTYKQTLRKFSKRQPMTHLGAVNLGLDICAALAVCRRSGYLYVDLKPNNIYVEDDHRFCIGDIGFIPLDSLAYASLPERYHSEYTAPEVLDAFASLNTTIDIYALGLILYQIYNNGALPTQDAPASSDRFPAPINADYEMAEIILKACDPNPEARWQNPIEMGQALVSYMQRNGANDTPIVPPFIPTTEPLAIDDLDLSDIDLTNIPEFEELGPEVIENTESDSEASEDSEGVLLSDESEEIDEETHAPAEEIPQIISNDIEDFSFDESENVEQTAETAEDLKPIEESIESPIDNEPMDNQITESIEDEKSPITVEESSSEEDGFENLSFLDDLPVDETYPENNLTDVEYNEVSDDLTQILAQIDELTAHPVPDPVVAPEAIEVVIPVSSTESDGEDMISDEVDTPEEAPATTAEVDNTEVESDEDAIDSSLAETVVIPSRVSDTQQASLNDVDEESVEEDGEQPFPRKPSALQWILNVIIVLLVLAILAVGFFYYKNIYLLPINSITVDGNETSMVVHLESNIDESLLSVVCSDSHGNQISAPVVNGTATFANLAPDTAYTVQIIVDGFHRLTGETAGSYSTPAQTKIVQFSAVTGTEDGSVILHFIPEGPGKDGDWSIVYSADGETEKTVDLLSHMETISGLTIGKEYTFTLVPKDDMYVTGQTQITFKASELVYAENVNIISCVDGKLTVNWDAPDSSFITEWTVRCSDADSEFNQTIITADTSAVFEDIDPAKDYTVEVTAAGMSVSQRAYMAANAITISNFAADVSSATELVLTWDASQAVPDEGWVLLYGVDSIATPSSIICMENKAIISPVIPDATYYFTLQLTNGDDVLTAPLSCQTPAAQDFSGYGVSRSSMSFKLCRRPDEAGWKYSDLSRSDYTDTFSVDEELSIVGQLDDKTDSFKDNILTLYVFRDADGNVVNYCYNEAKWKDMWSKTYGEFDVPLTPSEPGDYTLSIYFNGKLAANLSLTIEE